MINGRQRKYLKSLAHHLEPVVMIGSNGINDAVTREMDNLLTLKELIKVKIQKGSSDEAKEAANQMCEALNADFVQAVGGVFVLYRHRAKDPEIKLPK